MTNKDESWQVSNGSSGDGGRKRSSTFSQMQSKGYLDRVKEKRREVSTVMMKLVIMTISYYKGERLKMLKAFKEGVKKTVFFGTLSQTMGRWGSKVLNFLVKMTIQ